MMKIRIENGEGLIAITIEKRKYKESLDQYWPVIISIDEKNRLQEIEILSGTIDKIETKKVDIPKPNVPEVPINPNDPLTPYTNKTIKKEKLPKEMQEMLSPNEKEVRILKQTTRVHYDPKEGILQIQVPKRKPTLISKINEIITLGLTPEKHIAAIWIKFPPEITKKLNRNEQINEIIETP